MSHKDQGAVERVWRRVLLVIRRGRLMTADDSGPVQKQQIQISALEIRDNTPRLAEYGLVSMPPSGSDAVFLAIGGDTSNGVIIATANQQFRLKGLQSGEVAIHDNRGQSVYLTQNGIVVNGGSLPIQITNTPSVTINATQSITMTAPTITLNASQAVQVNTPTLSCSGDIIDNSGAGSSGNGSGESMRQMRLTYDGHTHLIKNVQGGQSAITSQQPSQQE